jgi:hypothetical protein
MNSIILHHKHRLLVPPRADADLSKWERVGLWLLLAVVLLFGAIVEIRGAFLKKRMTDLAVFLRAAWAVQSGADLYAITDDKGLPYNYPPLLAILLVPLADPPPGGDQSAVMPFAVKVALWYIASVVFLALAVHHLANALEEVVLAPATGTVAAATRRWWALRLVPLLACLAPICQALSLGQVNIWWVAMMCGMAAALLRGCSWRAGLWLSAAICMKVLPVFLILYPAWRRDRRCLAGCAVGLVLGLVVVPAAVLGPQQALAANRQWVKVMLLPAFGMGHDHSRDADLLSVNGTHNQALMAAWHKTMYLHLDRGLRPTEIAPTVRLAHWLVGGALTGIALSAAGRLRGTKLTPVLLIGALNVNMVVLSPAGHAHYLVLVVPLIMGLLTAFWEQSPMCLLSRRMRLLVVGNALAGALPLLSGLGALHDVGVPMYAALAIWAVAVTVMWKGSHEREALSQDRAGSAAHGSLSGSAAGSGWHEQRVRVRDGQQIHGRGLVIETLRWIGCQPNDNRAAAQHEQVGMANIERASIGQIKPKRRQWTTPR